jgi:hypothetical protein
MPATTATAPATLTAWQVWNFADLVRRLAQAYGPDADRHLHMDLVDGLFAFLGELPEPDYEEAPGVDYCEALRAGRIPNWGMDLLAITSTAAAPPQAFPAGCLAPAGVATCQARLTSSQVRGFRALIGRLATPGAGEALRQDLADGLAAFAALLPEPGDAGKAAYNAAVARGELPDWTAVPLTETTAEWAARVNARLAAQETEASTA